MRKFPHGIFIWVVLSSFLFLPLTLFAQGGTWNKKSDMPTQRFLSAISVVDGVIYVFGGTPDAFALTPRTEAYDPTTDTWTRRADMITGRVTVSAGEVNGKIYVIGGGTNPAFTMSTVEIYDPATDTWTQGADMPTARGWIATSAMGGKIYAIGGGVNNAGTPVSKVEIYDPATDTWTQGADMPTARTAASSSVVDSKIYVIGGLVTSNTGAVHSGGTVLSTVEIYDPATDTWTQGADMPTARTGLATSAVAGKIYAIGGTADEGVPLEGIPIMEIYDPATDTWTQGADMPTRRIWLSARAVGGKIYAIGGRQTFSNSSFIIFSTVEEYDTGFVPTTTSVNPTGKLATTWGSIKKVR